MIVALQAGCKYRPSTSSRLNLNDTIFAPVVISAVDPAGTASTSSSSGPKISTPIIIVISIVSFLVVCLAAGCAYMMIRRRNNKRKAAHESSDSFDFHCQTQMAMDQNYGYGYGINPATGLPYTEHELYWNTMDEKQQQAIVQHNAISPLASHPPNGLHFELPVDHEGSSNLATSSRWGAAISTDITQPAPAAAGPSRDEYVTPVSTTSMTSQTPFLKGIGLGMSPQINSYSPQMSNYSPNIGSYAPQARDSPVFTHEVWTGGHIEATSETATMVKVVAKIKGRKQDIGRPAEVKMVQTEFAPPPGQ